MVYRLETERLRLREWLPEDREPLAAMNADRRVMEFFPHYEGENETYIEASAENSGSTLYDKEIRDKPRTRHTKRNV